MRNRRALALCVSSSLLFTVAIIACSSDDTKSTFTSTNPDASFEAGNSFNTDSGSTVDGPIVCNPSIPATFAPQWIPPTAETTCTSADIEGYYDNCIANDASGKEQFTTKTCTDWIAANAACGGCIEKTDNSSPIQVFRSRQYYTLNSAGCIALEQDNTATTSCGAAYDAATQCRRESCDGCFDQAGAQFSDFIACQAAADATACGSYNTKSTAACTNYKNDDGGVPQCFPLSDGGTEAQKPFYERIIGYFCTAK